MNRKIFYIDPATGLLTKSTSNVPDPKFERRYTGTGRGMALPEEVFIITEESSRPFAQMIQGVERNRIDGGMFIPHGILQGKESYLSVAVTGASANFTPVAHQTAAGEYIWVTDQYYLVMDRRPKPEEMLQPLQESALNAEIIQLGPYVADTDPIPLNGATTFTLSHPKWAVIQPIVAMGASYNLETSEFGYKYRLEQPAIVTGVTGTDGTGQTIEASFNQSAQERKGVNGYMVSVLKKGDDIPFTGLKYGQPTSVPEWVFESEYDNTGQEMAVFALDSARLSLTGSVYTIDKKLNRYCKASDRSSATIVAGTYYVIVRAMNQTTFDEKLRLSNAAISAAVTVA
jgi:hypothetical protein